MLLINFTLISHNEQEVPININFHVVPERDPLKMIANWGGHLLSHSRVIFSAPNEQFTINFKQTDNVSIDEIFSVNYDTDEKNELDIDLIYAGVPSLDGSSHTLFKPLHYI